MASGIGSAEQVGAELGPADLGLDAPCKKPLREADFNLEPLSQTMPGVRFFACGDCQRVYVAIEKEDRCRYCNSSPVDELRTETQAVEYFSPVGGDER